MPAIKSGKVFVSGTNSHITVWVVRTLLDYGLAVHGTVYVESRDTHLRTLFADAGDKLELVIVEEVTIPAIIPTSHYALPAAAQLMIANMRTCLAHLAMSCTSPLRLLYELMRSAGTSHSLPAEESQVHSVSKPSATRILCSANKMARRGIDVCHERGSPVYLVIPRVTSIHVREKRNAYLMDREAHLKFIVKQRYHQTERGRLRQSSIGEQGHN
ncbi:uncharacterized protein BXZ73DRAFT_83113 [Epithele typhae]|uniref:uncharacterized protein n=1 Tax=Epithele typhae TaxID=378194 RepID=UPI0020082E4E|nr:uncharacterized protein BXZ73DRAFT_83113 [Epithele typhae]KAH9910847.1 hypothetical protein BXZ73DRAFT_83113 [Epithele typhae]